MNSGSFAGNVTVTGDVTANDFITTSDRDLKTNIQAIEDGLNTIKQFTSYEYEKAGKQDAGFIAQEVAEAIPYACLLYTSPSPRDRTRSRMPSSA